MYTKIFISEIPIIISDIIRPVIGIKYLCNLFLKCILENNAIAVIGVKLGGWGTILETIAIQINSKIKFIFFNFSNLYS